MRSARLATVAALAILASTPACVADDRLFKPLTPKQRRRLPTPEQVQRYRERDAEIAAWNAEVDRKKAERKARRLAKRAEAKP